MCGLTGIAMETLKVYFSKIEYKEIMNLKSGPPCYVPVSHTESLILMTLSCLGKRNDLATFMPRKHQVFCKLDMNLTSNCLSVRQNKISTLRLQHKQ